MLRITVHDDQESLTFQLEGRLAGPWVRELAECWQSNLARRRKPILRVDLTGVTFIDAAGQACLAALHRQGGAPYLNNLFRCAPVSGALLQMDHGGARVPRRGGVVGAEWHQVVPRMALNDH